MATRPPRFIFTSKIATRSRALGHEGHAQLLAQLEPLVQIADPRERLRALAHAYVAFGCAHPQSYRAAFIDVPGAVEPDERNERWMPGARMAECFADALDALRGADNADNADNAAPAEAFWAMLHGIVALSLTCPGFPRAPLGQLVDTQLDAWLRVPAAPPAAARTRVAKKTKATTA